MTKEECFKFVANGWYWNALGNLFFLSNLEAGVMTYGFVIGRPCSDSYYWNIFQNFPENILNGAI